MLIVGLGNFGKEFICTHHNVGFMTVDLLADRLKIKFSKKACDAKFFEGNLFDEKIIIAQPLTYMNLSGVAIQKLAKKFKISNEEILVIYDDLDLPAGKTRFRISGSGGTHNGMKNVVEYMGENVPRIRIGIGKDASKPVKDFVLSKMKGEEKEKIMAGIKKAEEAIEKYIQTKNKLCLEELNK